MSDKTKRVNSTGRTYEPVVKRAKPFGKDYTYFRIDTASTSGGASRRGSG